MPRPAKSTTVARGLVDPDLQRQVLELLHEAGARGATKAKLAEQLGISERQVSRAFQALREAGARITRKAEGGVRFVLEEGPAWEQRIPAEARLALDVALQLVDCPGGELWTSPLLELRKVVDGSLAKQDRQKLDRLKARITAHGTVGDAPAVDPEVLRTLLQALAQEPPAELELDYRDMHGKASTRRVAPDSLSHDAFSGAIHLLGWDSLRDQALHYRLNRIQAARLTGKPAIQLHRKALETIRRYTIGGWFAAGEPFAVKVRITGGWAQHLREACPGLPDAWVEEESDTSVILHFKALEHRGPLRVLLQFGADAEVLEPASLRKEISTLIERLVKQYSDSYSSINLIGNE